MKNLAKTRFPAPLLFFVLVVAMVVLNTGLLGPDGWREGELLMNMGLMVAAIALIGVAMNGRLVGLIIDNRNRVSLSKFQMLLWTIVVVSALATLAACRIRGGMADALEIVIPGELLAAMGIAATSFIGAPTVLSLKSQEAPTAENTNKADVSAQKEGAQLDPNGKVHGRADPSQARWIDMFRGDELGNSDTPDLSKIQQFAVTILLVSVYVSTLFMAFASVEDKDFKPTTKVVPAVGNVKLDGKAGLRSEKTVAAPDKGATQPESPPTKDGKSDPSAKKAFPNALPELSSWFIGLMAISHASYLVYKAAPHTSTGKDDAGSTPAGDGQTVTRVQTLG